MPDSSFARVRRVLISNMKDENKWEKMEQRVKERVVENQATHNMQMTHVWNARHKNLLLSQCQGDLKQCCESTRKCDVWGVLFTHTVGCSRLLSAVNDLTTTNFKKSCQSVTLSSLVSKRLKQVARRLNLGKDPSLLKQRRRSKVTTWKNEPSVCSHTFTKRASDL